MSSITLNHISKSYAHSKAINDISIHVPEGNLTALLGPSGCGKSTTLRMIAGLDSPSSGSIYFKDREVTYLKPAQRKVSMVFQSYALFPHLSVKENILFGPKARREPPQKFDSRVKKVANLLDLEHLLDRKPYQLSGGQQQRVALGRAVISEATICLMDEPLSNLDAQLRHEMRREIRSLQSKLGMTMLYVTHDQTEAMSMADSVVLLNAGKIEQHASPEVMYTKPATEFTARFIGTPPMNLIDLEHSAKGVCIKGLPESDLNFVPPSANRLGVRPEHIYINSNDGFKGIIQSVEYFGADTILICKIGENNISVRAPGHLKASKDESIMLSWSIEHQHFFDNNQSRLS